jgi:hypothetical protein
MWRLRNPSRNYITDFLMKEGICLFKTKYFPLAHFCPFQKKQAYEITYLSVCLYILYIDGSQRLHKHVLAAMRT